MSIFPSLGAAPQLEQLFRRFPETVAPLLAYHDRVLRDHSPLTVAERELIAAYVSALNACTYCHGSHVIAAEAFGVPPSLIASLVTDLESAPVADALRPLLRYVEKLTRTPSRMTEVDAAAVYNAGWTEQALFDAISVCALFCLMNRIVDGSGIRLDPLEQSIGDRAARASRMATLGDDPHQAPRSYSALGDRWGVR